ncbi:hypothetical protein Rleg_0197 [Rhizobium leguminosarum bv. trifolii WSM1325]|uniref:Uncharacterized protein n=1 Tax=Rhizobium leguminosarum bv. trifolii (strain WSM1325) TaxID=395491 RepID=C6B089_RHILS|nr:hypothetical protein [Rhizobium leguminosarum]ACS54508.1 hypothetical protein Rleg_0197 [Rhizobium leguminosarum bv. trifolii WSM1325]
MSGYQNSFADRFALIAGEGVLSKALTDARAKFERVSEKERAERAKLGEVRDSLARIEKIPEVQKRALSLNYVLLSAGKT